MPTPPPVEYAEASPAVRAVYDDIKKSRNVPDVNNFWKYLARDPATLKRTWDSIKQIMAPGSLDPLTKEMVYLAVSVTNGCAYCRRSRLVIKSKKHWYKRLSRLTLYKRLYKCGTKRRTGISSRGALKSGTGAVCQRTCRPRSANGSSRKAWIQIAPLWPGQRGTLSMLNGVWLSSAPARATA